ncbi:UDP-2,4-diacetamido-2,4,6-trideoxy-beta-L-altropyranose hydrolase [Vibrio genomosp. F6]|uniref:UDP-2,4-diacetamido-2,4, 6-trideoxy-beta-L-altropyranose hydrolase n=1 Tax=Vibrio genomosp. F6 str. FF-238 TaxID=1191298 RepID=A0A1E5D0Q5_9VIBR|nr:UDP-2,4-diacetamido-2,4,6-trideoxy-beta-L-altropyranose hydrolase [Vibrio genomosp. F6]OEE76426.1 UDP-2,4-diacetamido-2,4,6-trideoxy-beta-L-altropyranose hydrolase [Vibrio genomosp. F6 str. FF-238]
MRVIFRTDASIWVGSGHVMRCLVLADALKKRGHSISFACLSLPGDMISYIEDRGFPVINLNSPKEPCKPQHDADYEAWLQRPSSEDALDFIQVVSNADIVITDHYAISQTWQKLVRQAMGCFLVAIDDLVRDHDADLIVDQTLGRKPAEYSGSARALVGSEYAILAPNFSSLRELAYTRKPPGLKPKVLVSMGGIDNPNATLQSLKILVGKVVAVFTVLLSPRAPHYQQVKSWCASQDDVQHQDFEADMAGLMLKHDLAIGAPGTTSWERACLGLPSILVPLADNQKTICAQLLLHKAIMKVSLEDIDTRLFMTYQQAINQWYELFTSNLKLCDGLGAQRLVLEIQQLIAPDDYSDLQLAFASHGDIKTVYDWQCHPKTREFALNSNVPTWEEHQDWMQHKLASTTDFFYLVEDKSTGKKLGVLRLDKIEHKNYLVSIFVAPDSYGHGVATAALKMADVIHPDLTLRATVLECNKASQKLFKKANYTQQDSETFIRNPIQ